MFRVRDVSDKSATFPGTLLIKFRYDRISPPMREFLDGLTATCAQPVFRSACQAGNYEVMSPRGSPLNVGDAFAPVHPVIRTNRQTGWKSVFAGVGLHVTRINGLYDFEEKMIRDYILRLITLNHDCVARMHWTKGAAAIWNNSCVWHAATVRYVLIIFVSPLTIIARYAFGARCSTNWNSGIVDWRAAIPRSRINFAERSSRNIVNGVLIAKAVRKLFGLA